jgi:murein DD-endopeptidase MepM/ murein hydrolase activator NlpD
MMRMLLAVALSAVFASSCLSEEEKAPVSNSPLALDLKGGSTLTLTDGGQVVIVGNRSTLTLTDHGTQWLQAEGQMTQGGLLVGSVTPSAKLKLDGQPVMLGEHGEFVIGFDRDAPEEIRLSADGPKAEHHEARVPIAQRTWDIQRIDGLPPEQVTPTPEQLVRIKREGVLKKEARKRDTQGSWFTEKFIWPTEGRISGVFGSQRILNGEPRAPHYGLDVAAPEGTPIKAPAGGIVRLAEKDFYFEGGLVFLDHGHGLVSYLMHMSRVDVKPGQEVKQGDAIGAVGKTGRVTAAHLHWGIFWLDAHIDPQLLLPEQQKSEVGSQKPE